MAKVTVKVIGRNVQEMDAGTVGEVKANLGLPKYAASVNGVPQDDSYTLEDFEFVSLSEPVKGGQA